MEIDFLAVFEMSLNRTSSGSIDIVAAGIVVAKVVNANVFLLV
jgi:hypothetical protein